MIKAQKVHSVGDHVVTAVWPFKIEIEPNFRLREAALSRGQLCYGIRHFIKTRIAPNDSKVAEELAIAIIQEIDNPGKDYASEIIQNIAASSLSTVRENRGAKLSQQFVQLVPGKVSVETLLDVGCGKGLVTRELAHDLHLSPSKAYGIDIAKHPSVMDDRFTFLQVTDGKWNISDSSIDLLTLNMVLHHCKEPNIIFSEARRVLKPSGVMILRDHDAVEPHVAVIADTIESIMDRIRGEFRPLEAAQANYYPATTWMRLVENCGFRIADFQESNKEDPYRPFFIVAKLTI